MSDEPKIEDSPLLTSSNTQASEAHESVQNMTSAALLNLDADGASDNCYVTETQRNGSITGIGIVLGFSLIFTGQWSIAPGDWILFKVIALAVSGVGIFFQLLALFAILPLPLVSKDQHSRAIRKFTYGVAIMLGGFILHVLIDVAIDVLGIGVLKWPKRT